MIESDIKLLKHYVQEGVFTDKIAQIIEDFYRIYLNTIPSNQLEKGENFLKKWLELVVLYIQQPYPFEIFHQAIRSPFDFYQFGLDFMRPLVDFTHSKLKGIQNIEEINRYINQKHNVIVLANHQIEPDPQIISLMLEKQYPQLAADMIFIAGHRVISDPLAIPMSLGRNLLCIYSKKHMNTPPEEKGNKILHNQRTMKKMVELLNQGGKCIYVAPSGGRDRLNASGLPEVAMFDPESLELFYLMTKQAQNPTHFFTLALKTYDLMPPPRVVEKDLGEKRHATYAPAHLAFGDEVNMEDFPNSEQFDKRAKRIARAEYLTKLVSENYHLLTKIT